MDRTIVRIGARPRSRAWHIPALLVLGAAIVAACSGGSKDITGPPLGTAAGLVMVVQPQASVADRATLNPAPIVQVVDRAGTPVDTAGLTVTASIASGGGSVLGTTTAVTNASGQVTFSNLKIAGTVGAKALQFTSSGITGIQASGLTLTAGTATNLVSNSLISQNGVISQAVTSVPSVKAVDADGNGVSGIAVTFAVTAGGGSLTGGTPTTNASGVATVGSWTLGGSLGANTMTASASGLGGSPVTFSATGVNSISNFNIELQFILPPSPSQLAAFNAAKARWEQIIIGDLGPFNVGTFNTGPNCNNHIVSGTINDIRIVVELDSIDGPGQILGASTPCGLRSGGGVGAGLPVVSYMLFDTADVAGLIGSGNFGDVVLHEMGHSLGYGTIWNTLSLVNSTSATNPFFTGSAANTAYLNSNGGSASVTPPVSGSCSIANNEVIPRSAVPLENSGGAGTALSHWEECLFRSEVMSGYITGTVRPLSLTTVESMADLGYTVNPNAADPFNINTQPTLRAGQPDTLHVMLKDDVLQGPMYYIDGKTGAITPVPRR